MSFNEKIDMIYLCVQILLLIVAVFFVCFIIMWCCFKDSFVKILRRVGINTLLLNTVERDENTIYDKLVGIEALLLQLSKNENVKQSRQRERKNVR